MPPLSRRLAVVRRFRRLLAARALPVARRVAAASPARPPGDAGAAEVLASEVLPLLSAARFLEKEARFWLRPQKLGLRGRPLWLAGTRARILREPHGHVAVIAAGNYPLFLPGVQVLQALAAGNRVTLKPAPDGVEAARWLAELLSEAGLPEHLLRVTGPSVEDAEPLLATADLVLVTGGERAAAAVADACAKRLIPCVIEASGCDAAFVMAGADLPLAAASVAWGLRLNGSQTCIAPRRVLVDAACGDAFEAELGRALPEGLRVPVSPAAMEAALPRIEAAQAAGARLVRGSWEPGATEAEPFVLTDADPSMGLLQTDSFAPVTAIVSGLDGPDALLAADAACPYALGASVFGPAREAAAFAERLRVGVAVVNDLIAPTADPRLPFGGTGHSGHGVTRGAEGLLAMTRPRVVVEQRGKQRPHLVPPEPADAQAFAHAAAGLHGEGWLRRVKSLKAALPGLKAIVERGKG